MESGSSIFSREVHLANVDELISFMVEGIVISFTLVHPDKKLSGVFSKSSGILISIRLEQLF